MTTLRSKLIRLAYHNPDIRPALLPLVRAGGYPADPGSGPLTAAEVGLLNDSRARAGIPPHYVFYAVPERYVGFRDDRKVKRNYWKGTDPKGRWGLVCKAADFRARGVAFTVKAAAELIELWDALEEQAGAYRDGDDVTQHLARLPGDVPVTVETEIHELTSYGGRGRRRVTRTKTTVAGALRLLSRASGIQQGYEYGQVSVFFGH